MVPDKEETNRRRCWCLWGVVALQFPSIAVASTLADGALCLLDCAGRPCQKSPGVCRDAPPERSRCRGSDRDLLLLGTDSSE